MAEHTHSRLALFVVFVLSSISISYFYSKPELCFVHPELSDVYLTHAWLLRKDSSSIEVLFNLLDYKSWDVLNYQRLRFVSNWVVVLDTSFRSWLFQWIPPHPSLSLTWLFSFACPFLVFFLARSLRATILSSTIAALLFTASSGFLSGLSFRFHPGKPLTLFWTLLCLLLTSRLSYYLNNPHYTHRGLFWRLLGVSLLIFIGCFLDETFFFALIAIVCLSPTLFFPIKERKLSLSFLVALGTSIFCTITYLIPYLTRVLGFGGWNFWKFALAKSDGKFSLQFMQLLMNAINLLKDHLVFSESVLSYLFGTVVLVFLFLSYRNLPKESQLILRKQFGRCLIYFFLFHTLLLTRHLQVASSSYYYGNLFSLFVIFPLAVLLGNRNRPSLVNAGITIALLSISLTRFQSNNDLWVSSHRTIVDHARYHQEEVLKMNGQKATAQALRTLWKNKDSESSFWIKAKELPPDSAWVVREARLASLR